MPPHETIMPPMVVELVRQLVEEDGYICRAQIHSSTTVVLPMKIFPQTKVEMQSIFLSRRELVVLSFGWMLRIVPPLPKTDQTRLASGMTKVEIVDMYHSLMPIV